MLYQLRGVSHRYPLGRHVVPALQDVDLDVASGEFIAVAGPSGSGKTTLLNLLGLIDTADAGSVRFEDRDVRDLDEQARTRIRRERLGWIFQSFNLIPVLSAFENVEYFLLKRGVPPVAARRRVMDALEAVGVAEQACRRPNELSGGQLQRVAIARALVREADVILADEPTAALDAEGTYSVLTAFELARTSFHAALIVASHDAAVPGFRADAYRLEDGTLSPTG